MLNEKLFASINLVSTSANSFTEQHKALIGEITESATSVIEQIKFKEIISEKNKDISDNINYAQRIQSALMPSEELLTSIFPQSFLIFKQRDSLGGDFYWYEKLGDNVFFAIGDCTGHGVSGSLLTILSMDYIKQAVELKKFLDPALILEYLRDCLHKTLNKYNTKDEIMDGLDISFGVYNSLNNTFLFSSAMHNFYHIRNNELNEYKGNRKPIGGSAIMESSYYFTTHLFHLQKNDVVYFTTDGYIDQLQHKTEKRFGKTRFKQLLLQISDLEIQEQKSILLDTHQKWKGNIPQTDDICLMGFKV
jgi:serine phosphatase RsbU (regulator of sigma subunit)